jgi:hypothetical protein
MNVSDMSAIYKETSPGGLAVNLAECRDGQRTLP